VNELAQASTLAARQGRILVVDDEEPLARAISRMLTVAGHEVTTATDGRQAAELLSAETFDAIVSDIDMPRLNGIQLLQIVRQRDLDVPVVLMTGNPNLKTAVQAVAHGALQYLTKPVNLEELGKVVRRAVRLNRMAKLKRDALALVNEGGLGIVERAALEVTFERALQTTWMAYQPIARVADRALFGYEAVPHTDEKALSGRTALVDAADRLGRLEDLGRKVREAVCLAIPRAPPSSVFFLGVHTRDLLDASLHSSKSPLSAFAGRVVLEVTERASLDQVTDVRASVAELRRMGFRLAIDDLGAGYAGLTSFATLEPEFVKLDTSLIRDVDQNETKEKLVRSIAALSKELGMMVVGKGVETAPERDALVTLGCELLQGDLLAKPGKSLPALVW
jgi:EAL domain-containing protein (putative c-di-GMP-specific phosphodiesterase class I)/CheY-like chemotaxis protein